MSAGARVAERYRTMPTEYLRIALTQIRNDRYLVAVNIVLTERQEAYQRGWDAAQLLLDAVGGVAAGELAAAAYASAERQRRAGQYAEAEQSQGVAAALGDYLMERSDT